MGKFEDKCKNCHDHCVECSQSDDYGVPITIKMNNFQAIPNYFASSLSTQREGCFSSIMTTSVFDVVIVEDVRESLLEIVLSF
jgi:hypothetical protein